MHAQADQVSPTGPSSHLVVSLQGQAGSSGENPAPYPKNPPLPARTPAGRRARTHLPLAGGPGGSRVQQQGKAQASKREKWGILLRLRAG